MLNDTVSSYDRYSGFVANFRQGHTHSVIGAKFKTGFRPIGLCMLLVFFTACGKFTQQPETLAAAAAINPSEVSELGSEYALGTPSTLTAATEALFLGAQADLPYEADNGDVYPSLRNAHQQLSPLANLPIASLDTSANVQWNQGWTGKGVNVAVVDEFNSNDRIDSHGDKVALVVNSVAPEADIFFYDFLFINASAETAWENMNTNGYFIANNSFGRARYSQTTGEEDTDFAIDVAAMVALNYKATGPTNFDPKMLFIFAAGNSGRHCPDRRIHECSFNAAVTHGLRQRGVADREAMIWVGALNDEGTDLADYSHSAGLMANDFLVAHDNVLAEGDSAGTSYAAPRVAGAAALVRHKFPQLTGMQIKEILLDTARDLGADGPDPIFGHGALDLSNSLSPQGELVPD